jgi:hypothetical protein
VVYVSAAIAPTRARLAAGEVEPLDFLVAGAGKSIEAARARGAPQASRPMHHDAQVSGRVLGGLAVPIVQAPTASGPSTPALTIAVSRAGGLGLLAAEHLAPV